MAAGEDGCSFEMPVAAAAWATSSVNAATNAGFLRDEGALLVVFFLTDEPDKSPESRFVYETMLLDAKQECGGAECIFVSGLFPGCTLDVNQKLWQFLNLFDEEPPLWGDIDLTTDYAEVEDIAMQEYPGAVSDRIEVAQIFESDPIGIAGFDLDKPATPHEPGDD